MKDQARYLRFAGRALIGAVFVLKGDLKDFCSIRINDQWRVIFRWIDGQPHGVRIVDYH
jgi:plasmid maintenance system killer protein